MPKPQISDATPWPRGDRAESLAQHYAARIQTNRLAAGARLPSVRECARLHSVSATTVVTAYDQLQARGLVESRRQRGFYVRAQSAYLRAHGVGRATVPVDETSTLAPPVDATALIRGMFGTGDRPPGPGMGTLPEDWLDAPLLQRALRQAMRDGDAALRYGDAAGDMGFRAAVAQRIHELGVPARPAQVVSTVGATHALDIIARTLLHPGDAVLVDEPGWAVEFARLSQLGMRLLPVPRDADGPDLARMEALIKAEQPRLYVTVSTLHNPTGNCLTPAAAHRILRLAEAHDLLIVEDDTYAWLSAGHEPRLAALDGLQRTIYVSGFSKILAPDWRVGYLAAAPALVERFTDTKLLTTLSAPTLFERALAWLLGQGLLRRHAERIALRLDAARTRVQRLARDSGCQFVTPPQGLFGWLETGIDTAQLASQMAADGWLLAPGHLFMTRTDPCTTMRVNFATAQDARFWKEMVLARRRLAPRA